MSYLPRSGSLAFLSFCQHANSFDAYETVRSHYFKHRFQAWVRQGLTTRRDEFNTLRGLSFRARIRPMSRTEVPCPSWHFSILKSHLRDDSRLTEWQYQGHSQSVETFVFSFCSQAAISAFAENPASSSGLGRAKSRSGARMRDGERSMEMGF